jgi:hypothetical protein
MRNTTSAQPFSDSDDTMNSEVPAATEGTVRAVMKTLAPKRRMKIVRDIPVIAIPLPTPERSPFVRHTRMKRSGRMPLRWRGQKTPSVWISPEILSTFNEAMGALRTSQTKQAAHAAA